MEYLTELKKKYPDIEFLAVNSESPRVKVKTINKMLQTIQEWKIPFTVLVDDGLKIWKLYKLNALPTSIIIDKDGTVAFVEPNFYWGSAEKIEQALVDIGVAPGGE